VIHMGPENPRAWVPQKWAVLAAALKAQGYDLVATGGRGEDMESARLLNERVSIRDVSGRQSWQEFVSTIAGAAGVITVDTVTGHVAACFGVPTVVLTAGRQSLDLWRPNQSRVIALMHQVACAPCHRTRGCSAMACVRLIEVGDVLSSLQRVMKSQRDDISGASEAVPIAPLCSE
jgi:ADP-heptose:LPS heptosyltransferase